ncbi:NADPH:quinone reductase [Agreia sp. Leaf283]|uniref:NADPH:quinone reductase n=1 Tax=Agreia sp. Leaf283 TaxID=1736321 RepID=UPI0006FA76FA|nr:NADPH:quinone reductase [Agreia sp. Leaf283]KQP57262.1 NADPH:quinone reductase [Agreia sp. Leaf283]
MRAVTYDHTGDSSVLTLTEREPVEPEVGEVRVRVVVSGVNPTDWKSRAGAGAGSGPFDAPKVPNQDGAGVVDAVGEGVTQFSVGDRVWLWDVAFGTSIGTAQEYVTLPATHAVALPDDATFDDGASLGIPALTAALALAAHENLPDRLSPGSLEGRVVLVSGGAGAVSHAAIQLATWAGATVITTVSSDEKAELARRAGAEHILNYKTDDVAAAVKQLAPKGIDIIVEVNLQANAELDEKIIARGGTIVSYASDGDDRVSLPIGPAMGRNVRLRFLLTYTVSDDEKQDAIASVSEALAAGALGAGDETGLPFTRFALAETAAAHDAVEQGVVGKVLIDVTQ